MKTNRKRGLLMTVITGLALVGIFSSVYGQSVANCVTTFTPNCGYHLPNGVYYYTATDITLTTGKKIPAGYFYNPLTGDFFRVGAPGAGGSTTTPNLFTGAGSGSASGNSNPNGNNNNNQNQNVVREGDRTIVTSTVTGEQTVHYDNVGINIVWPRDRTNITDVNPISTSTVFFVTLPTSTLSTTSPGAPNTGAGRGGGGGAPGAPNAGLGGDLPMTLFNLVSSGILAAGAATYIIRNSINYKL